MEIIIGDTAGFCFGVKRAVDGLYKECESCKVDCYGEIVHNEEVCNNFKNKGVKFIDDIEEASNKVVIRAHGVPKSIYNYLDSNNIPFTDLTCPNVLKVHDIVNGYKDSNFIFLIGSKKHPEIIGTESYCGKYYYIIENINDIENAIIELKKSNKKSLLIISQTTYSSLLFDNIVDIIKKSNLNVEIIVKKTICNSTELRQAETEKLSKLVDLMIIVGSKTSSNTTKLYDIAKNNCKTLMTLNGDDINLDSTDIKIGIMAGASAPKESIDNVINILKGRSIK